MSEHVCTRDDFMSEHICNHDVFTSDHVCNRDDFMSVNVYDYDIRLILYIRYQFKCHERHLNFLSFL